jgi:hypothetical protein
MTRQSSATDREVQTLWRQRRAAAGKLASRLIAIALVLGVGVWAAATMRAVFSGPRRAVAASGVDARYWPSPADWLTARNLEGSWTFPDSPWRWIVRRSEGRPSSEFATRTLPGPASAVESRLLRLADSLASRPTDDPGVREHVLKRGRIRVSFRVARREGVSRLASVSLDVRETDTATVHYEAVPAPTPGGGARTALMPLSPGARSLATRCDRNGRALCEVVAVPSWDEAADEWRRQGWVIESERDRGVATCRRGHDVVVARVFRLGEHLGVLLVRAGPP